MQNNPPDPARPRPQITRWFYLCLGLGFVALGFVGVFVPVLPTTPFLILAAACFARSSQRLEGWLLSHPQFGPMLRSWRARGAIPMGAKWMAFAGCATGFGLFLWRSDPSAGLILLVAAIMLAGLGYVFTRPSA